MNPEHAPQPRFLSDVIVDLGFASAEKVKEAVEAARVTNKPVEQVLIEHGNLTWEQLAQALAERYGTEFVDLSTFEIDPEALKLVTRSVARRCHAVPIGFGAGGDELIVAISDSAGAAAAGDIGGMTRMRIKPVVAAHEQIEEQIAKMPEFDASRQPRGRGAPQQQQPPSPQQAPPPSHQPPPQQPADPQGGGLDSQTMEQVMRLADTDQEVDLSPDLKLISGETAGEGEERQMAELRSDLARMLDLEQDFRSTIEQVTDRLKKTGLVAGSERVAELEERLAAAEEARAQAERERDELRRRLAAIRDTLGGGGRL